MSVRTNEVVVPAAVLREGAAGQSRHLARSIITSKGKQACRERGNGPLGLSKLSVWNAPRLNLLIGTAQAIKACQALLRSASVQGLSGAHPNFKPGPCGKPHLLLGTVPFAVPRVARALWIWGLRLPFTSLKQAGPWFHSPPRLPSAILLRASPTSEAFPTDSCSN